MPDLARGRTARTSRRRRRARSTPRGRPTRDSWCSPSSRATSRCSRSRRAAAHKAKTLGAALAAAAVRRPLEVLRGVATTRLLDPRHAVLAALAPDGERFWRGVFGPLARRHGAYVVAGSHLRLAAGRRSDERVASCSPPMAGCCRRPTRSTWCRAWRTARPGRSASRAATPTGCRSPRRRSAGCAR